MNILNLTATQLRQAADLKEKIAALEKELAGISGTQASFKATRPAKRKFSASHIAKIRAAQKLRWAKVKAANTVAKVVAAIKPAKKKFTMSAAAKRKISDAAKLRWAKIKGAKPVAAIESVPVVASKLVKKIRKISAEGIARIKAAQTARWAAIRAGKKE